MHSYDVVGYTHSNGYCLCPSDAKYGRMKDPGNETGRVYPIFAGDEWDYTPTCDACGDELDVTLIGGDEDDYEDDEEDY